MANAKRVELVLIECAHALGDISRNIRVALLATGGRDLLIQELDGRIKNIRELASVLEDLKKIVEKEGVE